MKDVNVEFCHVYADSLDSTDFSDLHSGLIATREVLAALEKAGKSYSLNILIDNYFVKNDSLDFNHLLDFLASENLSPDGIYLEADLHSVCEEFIDFLKPVSVIRQPTELVFNSSGFDDHLFGPSPGDTLKGSFLRGKRSIPEQELRSPGFESRDRCQSSARTVIVQYQEDKERNSCPLLAACWVLARFGMQPFMNALSTFESDEQRDGFLGQELITILPASYLSVENIVMKLIGNLKTRSLRKLQHRIQYRFYGGR